MKKIVSLLLVLTVVLGMLAGCGAKSSAPQNGYYAETMAPAMDSCYEESAEFAPAPNITDSLPDNRKFIINVYMETESDDMDEMLATLNARITELAGYIESQNIRNGSKYSSHRYRSASLNIRIPVDNLNAFTQTVSDITNVVSTNQNVEDVTLTYVDTESHIAALQTEQERLMDLLEKADSLSDLLEIESRLTDVRYVLENYSSRMRSLDNQINYATVHINIEEVQEYTPVAEQTLWERISSGFKTSCKDLWEFLTDLFAAILIDLPYLVFYGIIITGIVFLVRALRRRKCAAKAAKKAAQVDTQKEAE